MKNILTNLRAPTLVSFLVVLPFMIMEVVNRRNFHEGFPVTLFGVMWLLPLIFLLLFMPIVRNVQVGRNSMAKPVSLLLKVVFLIFIIIVWIGALIDQMPCFLGVPLCD